MLKPHQRLKRIEIVLSGTGGQGIVLTGRILAEAAALFDKKEAVLTQSHGPEARGGASKAEVVISEEPIDYPKVIDMDILLAMSREAFESYGKFLAPAGLLIVDETFIKNIPAHFKNVFKAPFSSLAIDTLSTPIVANIIALGSLVALTKVVSRESLISALLKNAPDKFLALDRLALDAGFKLAQEKGPNLSHIY